jgi:alpha-beta hydrolase superfamily lysophospholipase
VAFRAAEVGAESLTQATSSRRFLGAALAAAVVLVGTCGDGGEGNGPAASQQESGVLPAPPTTLDERPTPDGPFAVGRRDEVFVDTSRPTKQNQEAPARPSRTLPTIVLYPAAGAPVEQEVPGAAPLVDEGPFPLVVFAHGFTGNAPAYVPSMRHWAAAGYVVAAPTFPLTSAGAAGGLNVTDYVEQPADVRYVLDSVLALAADGGPLAGMVDEEHVAVGGHSLGAVTTVALAFNDCCQDPRIDAVFPVSAATWDFDGRPDERRDLPVLLIHGTADDTLAYAGSVDLYRRVTPPKFLVELVNGPHLAFFGGPWPALIDEAVIGFLDRYLKERAGGLADLEHAGTRPGLTTLRSDADSG